MTFGQRTMGFIAATIVIACIHPGSADAQIRIVPEEVPCLPIEDNGVAYTQIENNIPDTTVRLNFRRMHDMVEDLYWVAMRPEGKGRYWGVFPKTADRMLNRHDLLEEREQVEDEYEWAQWWRQKQGSDHRDPNDELDDEMIRERASLGKLVPREWLAEMDDSTFQAWLEQLENEPAEYFISVHDFNGEQLARSKTRVIEVRENCRLDLNPQQIGEAQNLTVGETAHWQRGEEVFHWLCDGIVTRISPNAVKRGDEYCRGCVIAWYKKPEILVPSATALVTGGGILVFDNPKNLPASVIVP